MSPKYDPDTSHWDEDADEPDPWVDRTSVRTEIEVTLHDDGYQTDRRWTVHVSGYVDDDPRDVTAIWAEEHHNKGNFWRDPQRWRDAIDFVDLPRAVRVRVAAVLNRSLDEITPDERTIHRPDGTGVADMAGDDVGQCEVCGGTVYRESPPDPDEPLTHPLCTEVDG